MVWDKIPVNLHQLLKYSVGFLWVAKSVVLMFGEVVWTTRNKMLTEKQKFPRLEHISSEAYMVQSFLSDGAY